MCSAPFPTRGVLPGLLMLPRACVASTGSDAPRQDGLPDWLLLSISSQVSQVAGTGNVTDAAGIGATTTSSGGGLDWINAAVSSTDKPSYSTAALAAPRLTAVVGKVDEETKATKSQDWLAIALRGKGTAATERSQQESTNTRPGETLRS